MPAVLGHSGEGAVSSREGLGLLGLAFLGQTAVFSGILHEPVPGVGAESEQIQWVWREIPAWAAMDS